jgi:hypothetical protein
VKARHYAIACCAAWLAAAGAIAQDLEAGGTRFHFATAAETAGLVVADDDWTRAAGSFHRSAVARTEGPASDEAFKRALAATALDCTPQQVERWSKAISAAAPKLVELNVRLPSNVTIACTNGADAANAPHTRADTIYLPARFDHGPDEELMAHELVHIWSRRNPAAVGKLYALLGFAEAPPLEWPQEWREARLANPDAPGNSHAIRIEVEGTAYSVMPVLVARRSTLSPRETIFAVMDVRLLAVQTAPDGRSSIAVRRDGQPLWWPAFSTPAYLARLGGNTPYVIHPEETLADNVAYLVSGRQVRNPALLSQVRQALASLNPIKQTQ